MGVTCILQGGAAKLNNTHFYSTRDTFRKTHYDVILPTFRIFGEAALSNFKGNNDEHCI